jgi:acyl dehydratase
MAQAALVPSDAKLDLRDLERRVGQPVGGGQLWEPCSAIDVRRWVHALDYPNPIHWDQEFALKSKFRGVVAPQSFAVCMDYGHGCQPACVGRIEGSHLIFGGEEWWFYGPRIRPGDQLFQTRRFHGFKVSDTKFAGPTVFSEGDTLHTNQDGAPVAKERSTSIRYLVSEAEKRGMFKQQLQAVRQWTPEERKEIASVRHKWILSNREGLSPRFEAVKVGDKLPRRVLGPHTPVTFACEYRAFMFNAWGSWHWSIPEGVEDPWVNQDAGFTKGFEIDYEGVKVDPRVRDGLFQGPSSGHTDSSKADKIGMARAYGYGATMGAWVHDYVAYWAGHDGFIRYSKSQFRGPAFEGDVTYCDGEVIEKSTDSPYGMPTVTVAVKLANQNGDTLVNGRLVVELPY